MNDAYLEVMESLVLVNVGVVPQQLAGHTELLCTGKCMEEYCPVPGKDNRNFILSNYLSSNSRQHLSSVFFKLRQPTTKTKILLKEL